MYYILIHKKHLKIGVKFARPRKKIAIRAKKLAK